MSAYSLPAWNRFLEVVRLRPAEDSVRLQAADWLADHGDVERAELIQVQCELASFQGRPNSRLYYLQQRERILLNSATFSFQEWMRDICPTSRLMVYHHRPSQTSSFQVQFHRGFPMLIQCTPRFWEIHQHKIVPRQPIVAFQFYDVKESQVTTEAEPLNSFRALDFSPTPDPTLYDFFDQEIDLATAERARHSIL